MEAYIDCMPIDGLEPFLVFIHHKDTKEVSIVGCDRFDLAYLGVDDLARYSVGCSWPFTDDDGESHDITILKRNY